MSDLQELRPAIAAFVQPRVSYCSVEWALLAPLQATESLPVNYNLPVHSRPHSKEDFKNNLII